MNRRQLLQLAAALAVSSPGPADAGAGTRATAFTTAFNRPAELRALAARCAGVFPAASSTTTLLAACGLSHAQAATASAQLEAFAQRRHDDFRSGHIAIIDGWVMAHSECALCCLLARS